MVTARRAVVLAALALLLPACLDDVGEGLGSGRSLPLAAPGGLAATPRTPWAIDLEWTDRSIHETGHRIDVHVSPFDGSTSIVADVVYLPANATSHTYASWPNRTLYFRVLALTDALESDPSNTASATTPPSAPTPVRVATGPVSTSSITVSWEVSGSPLGARVERSPDGGASWIPVYDAGPVLTYTDTGLLPGREYDYRVCSRDAYGLSLPSEPARDTTQSTDVTVTTLAAASGLIGLETAIAVRNGVEYITHYAAAGEDVMLTSGAPGGLYTTRAIDAGPAGVPRGFDGTSLVFDSAGAWHAVACEFPGGDLRYVAGPTGIASTIDTVGDSGHYPRIAVSPLDGSLQVVHLEREGTLKRAIKRGNAAWIHEIVAVTEMIPYKPSFILDTTGKAHVVFAEWTNGRTAGDLVYATQEGDQPWVLERLGIPWTIMSGQSVAVDPAGVPHVAYITSDPLTAGTSLFVARKGATWVSERVHGRFGHSVGAGYALAISPADGAVHLAYHEHLHQDLRYARKLPGGAWMFRVLDTAGFVGTDLSLALDAGRVHIAYHDATNGDLKRVVGTP
jgi:hypothetical protein